jgi:hypothetical protein
MNNFKIKNKIVFEVNKTLIYNNNSILVIAVNKHSTLDYFVISKSDLIYINALDLYFVEFVERFKQVLADEIKNDINQNKFDYRMIKLLCQILNSDNIHYLDLVFVFTLYKNKDKQMKNLKKVIVSVIKEISKC